MKKSNKFFNLIICLISFLLLFSSVGAALDNSGLKVSNDNLKSLKTTVIKKIIDGDTIKASNGETIRLIGVDTPEIFWDKGTAEFYGYKAMKFTRKNLLNKKVYLRYGQKKRDDYGRVLAYIYLENGELFNIKLLNSGYAHLMTVAPNTKYLDNFTNEVVKSRAEGSGIWSQIKQLEKEIPVVSWDEVKKYYGKKVIVEGKIINTYQSDKVVFLNFSKNYNETLTVVIFNNDLNKFAIQPEKFFLNKKIKVMGIIKKYEGAPEIIVENPSTILSE